MDPNAPKLDYDRFLAGTVADAWNRCLPRWRPLGRVEDFPRNMRRMMYWPSEEKSLGREFAGKFRDQYTFIVGKLSSPDPVETACAHDLLSYIFDTSWEGPDPAEIVTVPIPDWVRDELGGPYYESFQGSTLGELFRFELYGE